VNTGPELGEVGVHVALDVAVDRVAVRSWAGTVLLARHDGLVAG
jgi:hypothetical protein